MRILVLALVAFFTKYTDSALTPVSQDLQEKKNTVDLSITTDPDQLRNSDWFRATLKIINPGKKEALTGGIFPGAAIFSTSSESYFAETIASAGDVNNDGYSDVIIANPYFDSLHQDEGRAWVYYGTSAGLPVMPDVTLYYYSNIDGYEYFGFAAAGAGDINKDGYSDIVIGAHRAGGGAEEYNGRVLVYYGSSTGIPTSPDKILNDNIGGSSFGFHVAGGGDINGDGYSDVIIGAPSYGYLLNQQDFYGRVYIYYGSSRGLADTAGSYIDGEKVRAYFGYIVTNAGDINGDGYSDIAVSEDGVSDNESNLGIVKVYLGADTGLVTQYANRYTGGFSDGFTGFGRSLAGGNDLNGDGYADLVINQPFYHYSVETPQGTTRYSIPRIWICYGAAGGLPSEPVIISQAIAGLDIKTTICNAGDANGDGYADMAVSGDHFDSVTAATTGRLVIYYGSPAGLTDSGFSVKDSVDLPLQLRVTAAGDINGDGYADLLGGYPDVINHVGSPNGPVYVLKGMPDETGVTPAVTTFICPGNSVVGFGRSVCHAGDINGDGFADVIISDPNFFTASFSYDGAAYVYYGSRNGLPLQPQLVLRTSDPESGFGRAVAGAGDLNGDGYSDIIVSEPHYKKDEGKVFIYYGSRNGLLTRPSILTGGRPGVFLGYAVAGAGDINGDGYADMLVSAYNGITKIDTGKVFVYYGSAHGVGRLPSKILQGSDETAMAGFGRSLGSAGDVNGDGFTDVVIGAASGIAGEGRAYIFYGAETGVSALPASITGGPNHSDMFTGSHVAGAGDINGDGYADILVWAIDQNTGLGMELIYYGSASGIDRFPSATITGNAPDAYVEDAVSGADVNSDGYSDVLVFANWPHGHGVVLVYKGSCTGLLPDADTLRNPANEHAGGFGKGFSSAGDVNGDGYDDVLVGEESSIDVKGRAYLFYGNGKKGYRNNLRLYNTGISKPLSADNLKKDKFGAGLFAKSPLGLQKGRLVWETRTAGMPFSGIPLPNSTGSSGRQAAFSSLGLSGIELKNLIAKTGSITYIRARVEYDPVTSVTGQRFGPWRYAVSGVPAVDKHQPDPLDILRFTARKQYQDVLLNWSVAGYKEGVYYAVERSADNSNFRELSSIAAHAYSNDYCFVDEHPLKGKNFYRIRSVYKNRFEYSKVNMIEFKAPRICYIHPNPVFAGQTLHINLSPGAASVAVELLDVKKKLVLRRQISAAGEHFRINVPSVQSGLYWIVIYADDSITSRPIFVIGR